MYDFYKMIESYMKERNDDTKWEVRTNVIVNWGTYSEEQFKVKDVSNPTHPDYNLFIGELYKIKDFPNIVHNFHHLYETKPHLI